MVRVRVRVRVGVRVRVEVRVRLGLGLGLGVKLGNAPLHLALLDEGDVGDESRDVEQRDAALP